MEDGAIRRDEKGRVIASDGWPLSGLATVDEAVAVSGLSHSTIYNMLTRGDLESQRFGRSRRIPWRVIRENFLDSADA